MTHKQLLKIFKQDKRDYAPWGEVDYYSGNYSDCSCGCRFYVELDWDSGLGADWGVCCNPASHRCGLLTFEHQGCKHFKSISEKEMRRRLGNAID